MHSLGPSFGVGVGELIILLTVGSAFVAFAIFVLALLVKRFGALRTFGWGFSLFFLGLIGLSLVLVQVRTANFRAYDEVETASVQAIRDASSVSVRSHAQPRAEESSGDYALSSSVVVIDRGNANVAVPLRRRIQPEEPAASAWDENIAPVANIYPSVPDCGRPLAAKLVKQLQKDGKSKDESPKAEADESVKYQIALVNKDDLLHHSDFFNFVIKFREQFTTSFPGSLVENMTGEKEPMTLETESDSVYQQLQITVYELESKKNAQQRGKTSSNWNGRSGQLVCQTKRGGRRGKIELVTNFIEKPWVADPEKFTSQNAKQKLIIGFSPRFATSEQEARVSALKDANVRLAKSTNKIFQPNYDMEKNVVDRFVQKLTMPYGNVWREAVLVDLDSPTAQFMQFVGDTIHAERMARGGPRSANRRSPTATAMPSAGVHSRSRANPESLIAGLMLLTIVVGWISNHLTQGYYRGPVWTVTGTLFSIGFVFLIFVVLMNFA